ncbi:MAG: hypothetical protein WED05_12510 [Candidatus Atabeyarchaeum deiterrae]
MYTDFLIGIGYLLGQKDRTKLLRLTLSLTNRESDDFARVFYELAPYLKVEEKRKYGSEALESDASSLSNLVILSSCSNYLPKDNVTRRIRLCLESIRRELPSVKPDLISKSHHGFVSFMIQQGLSTIIDYESDSISVIANIVEQEDRLNEAAEYFSKSRIWLSRISLAQASLTYLRATKTTSIKVPETLDQARRKALASTSNMKKFSDYGTLFTGFRVLYLIDYRIYTMSHTSNKKALKISSRMRHDARLMIVAGENVADVEKLAGAYTDMGIALRIQGELEKKLAKKRLLLESAREMHLKAASMMRGINDGSFALHLYNAGSTLIGLASFEPNDVKLNDLYERASKEMDEVISLSSASVEAKTRVMAIITKLLCMEETSESKPVSVTADALAELDRLSKQLEEIRARAYELYVLPYAYMNLSRYYLKLLRNSGRHRKEFIEKANTNAIKAYEIAESISNIEILWAILLLEAEILTAKGIMNNDLEALDKASVMIEKSCELVEGNVDSRIFRSLSFAPEIHLAKYGFTGNPKELSKAIAYSKRCIAICVKLRYLQFAGEESFRLATMYVLAGEDRRAEESLDQAARLFKKSGEANLAFKRELDNSSRICKATKKLVKAQTALKAGQKARARALAEQAENEMVKANARWREVWLVRGLKELILGNPEEAKKNLIRILEESLDEKNPISTGYTAKRLMSFIDEDSEMGKKILPPTVIDMPLKSETILAVIRLDRIGKEISSMVGAGQEEQKELNIDEIRETIRRLTGTGNREEKNSAKKTP